MVIMEIKQVFNDAQSVNVYNDGVKVTYSTGTEYFNKILDCWNTLIGDSRQVPALGVSLNAQTKEDKKSGLWLEFCFAKQLKRSDMPFEKLLINVRRGDCGINIIRYTANYGYDGRCYYLDLVNKNTACLYELLYDL